MNGFMGLFISVLVKILTTAGMTLRAAALKPAVGIWLVLVFTLSCSVTMPLRVAEDSRPGFSVLIINNTASPIVVACANKSQNLCMIMNVLRCSGIYLSNPNAL